MNKKYIIIFLVFILLVSSCGTGNLNSEKVQYNNVKVSSNTQEQNEIDEKENTNKIKIDETNVSDYKTKEIDLNLKNDEAIIIELDSENTNIISDSIQISGQKITIKKSGNYEFSGTLSDGQIIVETEDEKDVQIVLNGVNITSLNGSAILVNEATQTIINLADNSVNNINDGETYLNLEDENAAIFSKDDLIINGNGELNINGNYKDGITSKDKLFIDSGNINIIAKNDGIRGKDYILINDGDINITAEGDGLKSDNEDKGTILINGGNINISSGDDGINSALYIVINDGNINVDKSYEAMEAMDITFNGGNINLVANDDGINAVSSEAGGIGESAEQGVYLRINGGNITLDSQGDGLDSNGDIVMTGGNVTVYGPTQDSNGFLDYNGNFEISGGSLIAIGSSGMAKNIGTNSSQYGVLIGFNSSISTGTIFTLKNSSGNIITNITSKKTSQAIIISNSDLEKDETYSYSLDGETIKEFTISSITTTVGNITEGATRGDKGDRIMK